MSVNRNQRRVRGVRGTEAAGRAGFEALESRTLYSAAMPAAVMPHPMEAAKVRLHAAAPALGGTGVSAEYFADSGMTQPSMTRTDPSISFAGAKGFAQSLKAAGSVQWTGSIAAPASGTYTFSVQSNGSVGLSIGGKQLIATSGGSARSTTPLAMVAGQKYAFQMTYAKAAGATPSLKLFWGSAKVKQQVVPQASLFPAAAPPTMGAVTSGLIGQYFVGNNFQQLAMTRVDASINFNFGTAPPDASIPARSPFTVQWTGQFTPATTDDYTFTATADDGVRVYVDGQLVVNDYTVHSVETAAGSIVLDAGQSYDLKVQYFNSTKQGTIKLAYATSTGAKQPLAASVLSSTPPAAAGLLGVTDAEANEVDLAWTGSAAATGYTVSQTADGGQTWQVAGTTPAGTTTFADAGLTADTAYQFRVAPLGSSDTSTPSNVASATTLVPAPAGVTATVDDATSLDLSWADVPGETGFTVLASAAGGPFVAVGSTPATDTNYHVAGLLPGTAYAFEVQALNAAGQPSDAGGPAAATTPSTGPAGLVAVGLSTGTATLAWVDTAGNGGFVVERSADGTTWAAVGTTPADVTTFADSGLSPGTTYNYRVRSIAAADASVVSGPSNVATATTVTDAPAGVTATPHSDVEVDLAWADVAGEGGFVVLASADGGATFAPIGSVAAGSTTFAATPLLPAAAYQFEVEALNAAGVPSAPSAVAAATTPAVAPAALTAVSTSTTSAALIWTPAVGATGYQLERSADAGATWATIATPAGGTTTTYTDATLSAGTSYVFRVRATDAGGAGDASPVAVALTLPAAPAAVVAGVDAATTQVSWPAVTGAASYVVQRSANGTTGWATVATPTDAGTGGPPTAATPAANLVGGLLGKVTALLANPAASTLFYYRVTATNATGSSAPSPVVGQMTAPLAKYAATTQVFGNTASDGLYSVDFTGGTSTLIGQITPGTDNALRSPVDGKVYSLTAGQADPTLYSWDPATGNNAAVGTLAVPSAVNRATFRSDNTVFFTTADGSLYREAYGSLTATRVGPLLIGGATLPITSDGSLAFAPSGNLYMTANSSVYMVSTTTGTATLLAALPTGTTAFVFGQQGLMYSTTPSGSQYTLSLSSLVPTALNNGAVPTFTTLTAVPKFDKFTTVASPATTTFSKGHTGTFQVQVTNAGPDADAGPITCAVTLPTGLTYAAVAGAGWAATAATAAGGVQTVTLTYAGTVAATAALPTASLTVNVAASAPATTLTTFVVTGANFGALATLNTTAAVVACT